MAESAPDRGSAQASKSTQPQHDERNDEVEGDESAALLSSDDNTPPSRPPVGLSSPKAIYTLTSLALSFSVATLVILIATQITLAVDPSNVNLGWQTMDGMKGIIAPAIFSLLFSAFNIARLRRSLTAAPLLINIVADILIAIFAIAYGAAGLGGITEAYCYSYPHNPGYYNSCMRRALPAQILAGITLGVAVVFGTVHLTLFVARCIVAYRAQIWKGPWRFPDGQLTVELSLKLFKEPQKPREVGVEESV